MNDSKGLINSVRQQIDSLISYCEKERWKGYDPYDGLNSPIYKWLFFDRNKYFRIIIIQFFKNFPINLRSLFFIKKEINAKALAIFIKGLIIIYKNTNDKKYFDLINNLADLLIKESMHGEIKLWGYSFDWQNRTFLIKKHLPNMVVTYFALDSLLDLYYLTGKEYYKHIFINSCDTVIDKFLYKGEKEIYFNYVTNCNDLIHNVNLFGSSLMAKAYKITNEEKFLIISEATLKTTVKYQENDGSWFYGQKEKHHWIDSFHTCYNLLSLKDFMINTGKNTFENNLISGLNYYLKNFFTDDFIIKYFNNKKYPIDIHCLTVGLITLIELEKYIMDKDIISNIYKFLIENFRSRSGFFYYRKGKFYKNRISYIRWNQAWSLLSLVKFYEYLSNQEK